MSFNNLYAAEFSADFNDLPDPYDNKIPTYTLLVNRGK